MQMKWFSNFLALNTPFPANLLARLKLNFPLLLTDVCVPTACPGSRQQPEPAAHGRRVGTPLCLGLAVSPAPCQQDSVLPGDPHRCCPGPLTAPKLSAKTPPVPWGSASQAPEPSGAVVPPSPAVRGTVPTIQHCAHHRCLLHWEVLLDAAPDCSAYIHQLLIALKIFKD